MTAAPAHHGTPSALCVVALFSAYRTGNRNASILMFTMHHRFGDGRRCIITHEGVRLPLLSGRPVTLSATIGIAESPGDVAVTIHLSLPSEAMLMSWRLRSVCTPESSSRSGPPAVTIRPVRLRHQHHRQKCRRPGAGNTLERDRASPPAISRGRSKRSAARGALPRRPRPKTRPSSTRSSRQPTGRRRRAHHPDLPRHDEQRVGRRNGLSTRCWPPSRTCPACRRRSPRAPSAGLRPSLSTTPSLPTATRC